MEKNSGNDAPTPSLLHTTKKNVHIKFLFSGCKSDIYFYDPYKEAVGTGWWPVSRAFSIQFKSRLRKTQHEKIPKQAFGELGLGVREKSFPIIFQVVRAWARATRSLSVAMNWKGIIIKGEKHTFPVMTVVVN